MRALIADDDPTVALILRTILKKMGYDVRTAENGAEALERLQKESFDAVIADWMMPEMDGMELVRRIRETVRPAPYIIVATSLDSSSARDHAMTTGADDFLVKPVDQTTLVKTLSHGQLRHSGRYKPVVMPQPTVTRTASHQKLPDHGAVVIAASTGGPPVLSQLICDGAIPESVYAFIVVHGPGWMHESLAAQISRASGRKVRVPEHGERAEPGIIYMAGREAHLLVEPDLTMRLDRGMEEHFTRPAADPLFRSAARVFGKQALAVVLTGIGRDGADGAKIVSDAGGRVVIQDPDHCVAPGMPASTAETCGARGELIRPEELASRIRNIATRLVI